MDSSAPIAVLFEKKHYGTRLPSQIMESLGADAFNCSVKELSEKWLADLHSNSIPFNVYTVNDEKNMRRLLAFKASGMFTNNPDILRKAVEDFRWTQNLQNR
jgi:glycerophosphoryl diester phosphodiesterase